MKFLIPVLLLVAGYSLLTSCQGDSTASHNADANHAATPRMDTITAPPAKPDSTVTSRQ